MGYPSLVGHHENKGHLYAYKVEDLMAIKGDVILELNPALQQDFPKELIKQGVELVGWIGLEGEPEYLGVNISNRSKKDTGYDIDPVTLSAKLDMADTIMKEQRKLADQGVMTIFKVGWDNRDTMGQEFADSIKGMLGR